ncbi:SdpI family protein [Aureisphaera galaxeae]|uniref:SdpI family protein n=1 Tax=Aureisphaera galaxeae TaxID=1538023 RepID=UPI0023507E1B|nr:SdpI family protein [Aureisphaera galaxeae]MDC8005311.1 SdpI family protein [Aureisphaera galaxeae]
MTAEFQLLLGVGYCVFMLILFLIFKRFPPKKINMYYGYRTTRSMRNETIWKAANEHSIEISIRYTLYSFFIPAMLYFLYPQYNLLGTIIGNTLLILLAFFSTERYLSKHFDAMGNPKE